jgi:hypothetical protein
MGPLFQIYLEIWALPRSIRRQLVGLRSPNLGSRTSRGARALHRHLLQIRYRRRRRLCQTDCRHRGGSGSNSSTGGSNSSNGNVCPASKATGRFMVPSKVRPSQCSLERSFYVERFGSTLCLSGPPLLRHPWTFLPRWPPCPPGGLVPIGIRLLGTSPAIRQRPPWMLLPRRLPCPSAGLVPISIHLLGMSPVICQRLPQPHQRRRQAHHRRRLRRFLLHLPPPCRMTLVLRWRHWTHRILLSPSRQRLRVPKFQLGVQKWRRRQQLLQTQQRRYRRMHRRW